MLNSEYIGHRLVGKITTLVQKQFLNIKSNYLKTPLFWNWFVSKWGVLKRRQFKQEYIWRLEVAGKYWCVGFLVGAD